MLCELLLQGLITVYDHHHVPGVLQVVVDCSIQRGARQAEDTERRLVEERHRMPPDSLVYTIR